MRLPPLYALFCVLVLGSFAYAKYQGLALLSSAASSSGSGGGGRSSGGYSGSHK